VLQSTSAQFNKAKAKGLNMNDNKTKVMELILDKNQVDILVIEGHTFEKV
jgi:hypothetical protein